MTQAKETAHNDKIERNKNPLLTNEQIWVFEIDLKSEDQVPFGNAFSVVVIAEDTVFFSLP